jgi:hypothetical protein
MTASKTTSKFKSKARQFTQGISQCRECISHILPSAVPWGSWTWIVRHTFRRLYAFIVMALLIAVLGIVTIERMPTDIFLGSTGPGAPVC